MLTALGHLAKSSQQNQAAITAEGILPALIVIMGRDDSSLQIAAASVLMHMIQSCQAGRAVAVQAGAAQALAAMLQSFSFEVLQSAAACLAQLARGS